MVIALWGKSDQPLPAFFLVMMRGLNVKNKIKFYSISLGYVLICITMGTSQCHKEWQTDRHTHTHTCTHPPRSDWRPNLTLKYHGLSWYLFLFDSSWVRRKLKLSFLSPSTFVLVDYLAKQKCKQELHPKSHRNHLLIFGNSLRECQAYECLQIREIIFLPFFFFLVHQPPRMRKR